MRVQAEFHVNHYKLFLFQKLTELKSYQEK
jgi:hypothetical protein